MGKSNLLSAYYAAHMAHGRDWSWEEREDCAAWPDSCYGTWNMCTAPGGVNGPQQQQPCSFCPPLPSFRKFAPGHINAENRDLQMLLLAATSSCHSEGSCVQSTRLSFFCLMPALLREEKEAVGLLSHYPGFFTCLQLAAEQVGAAHQIYYWTQHISLIILVLERPCELGDVLSLYSSILPCLLYL